MLKKPNFCQLLQFPAKIRWNWHMKDKRDARMLEHFKVRIVLAQIILQNHTRPSFFTRIGVVVDCAPSTIGRAMALLRNRNIRNNNIH
jgi:hypothetical protein